MSEFLGRDIEFGVAIEGSRGDAESTASRWLRHVNADIIRRVNKATDDATRGRLEASDGTRVTQKWFDGDLSGIIHADALGYLLYSLYGDVDTSEIVADEVHSHEFTLAQNNTHPALTLFAKDGDVNQRKYAMGMVNTLELSATTDDYVRFTANMVAKDESSDSSTPSYSKEFDFVGRDITVKAADAEDDLSAADPVKAKNITVNWTTGLIRDPVFGSYNPGNLYNANFGVEVQLTKNYVDETLADMLHADTAKYVQVHIEGEADIGSGNNPSITLLLNKAQVSDWSRSGGNDELVTEDVTLVGYFNADDEEQSKITLQNKTASYGS